MSLMSDSRVLIRQDDDSLLTRAACLYMKRCYILLSRCPNFPIVCFIRHLKNYFLSIIQFKYTKQQSWQTIINKTPSGTLFEVSISKTEQASTTPLKDSLKEEPQVTLPHRMASVNLGFPSVAPVLSDLIKDLINLAAQELGVAVVEVVEGAVIVVMILPIMSTHLTDLVRLRPTINTPKAKLERVPHTATAMVHRGLTTVQDDMGDTEAGEVVERIVAHIHSAHLEPAVLTYLPSLSH